MAAFEITMASYAVAHLKVALALPVELRGKFRLPIYLTDTLRPPKAAEGTLDFSDDPVTEERRLADVIKDERTVTVIIGNPPYRERARGKGGIVEMPDPGTGQSPSLDLFKYPGAGREEFNLHNLNVYFWRWATWKAVACTGGAGVVSFITTSPYLTSPAFKGMRAWTRRNTTHAYIVDCTPEGHQPPVPTRLFPGVQQPLAIMTMSSSMGTQPNRRSLINYSAIEGSQAQKFENLDRSSLNGNWKHAPDDLAAPFLALGTEVWERSVPLVALMPFNSNGLKPNRPWPNAPHVEILRKRWDALLEAEGPSRELLFKVTRDRDLNRVPRPLPGFPKQESLSQPSPSRKK
jgi:hypothetical protein